MALVHEELEHMLTALVHEEDEISYDDFLSQNPEDVPFDFSTEPIYADFDDNEPFINHFASKCQQSVVGEEDNKLLFFEVEDDDNPYPTKKPRQERIFMSEQTGSNFGPPPTHQITMNSTGTTFGPSTSARPPIPPILEWSTSEPRPRGRPMDFKHINLPQANISSGSILELPTDISR